jgi:hypothetical protein
MPVSADDHCGDVAAFLGTFQHARLLLASLRRFVCALEPRFRVTAGDAFAEGDLV